MNQINYNTLIGYINSNLYFVSILKIAIKANLEEWDKIRRFLESSLLSFCLKKTEMEKIILACEEIFTNICRYAYKDKTGTVIIALDIAGEKVIIKITDDGAAFNPIDFKDMKDEIKKTAFERKIGGMGIHIVRKIMDKTVYLRVGKRNYFFMFKNIKI